ncbi:ACP S-malonyltransferase [Limosilactobacillus sp.]|jgi:[acyl-carrier-protein] S-malonyltransferase|uniref:ACP S-malonyltransferase n=1 Tax=Limosilactobacillus sp. TaxID=2773925 RepID=UPI00345E06F8
MRLGILFSGQGAQKPGMGLDFLSDPLFTSIVSQGSQITGLDLEKIMASKDGELKQTKYVQPALVAMSFGIYQMLKRDLPQLPIFAMAGLSLGEYAALIASKAISADRGLSLLKDRGAYMQADADQVDSTMAAVLNPVHDKVAAVCDRYSQVWVANYNSPQQVVLGGATDQVKAAAGDIKAEQAAKRVVVLKVSGAFHTPLFNGARAKMHDRLAEEQFHKPTVPVISNTVVAPFTAENIASIMERQLAVSTHFGEDVQYMVKLLEIDATLEIGPGKTLSRFAKQVDSNLVRTHIGTLKDYQTYLKENQQWS